MQATAPQGLLGAARLHARIEDIKRSKGAPPWSEKLVVNDQIVGTLICQPAGHKTDTHYHLVDEWWVVLEGEIDWEIEPVGPMSRHAQDNEYSVDLLGRGNVIGSRVVLHFASHPDLLRRFLSPFAPLVPLAPVGR